MEQIKKIIINGKEYEVKGDNVYIRYSANADGENFTKGWSEGQGYIGIASATEEPKDKSDFVWSLLGAMPDVVQGAGSSENSVMSQKAVTEHIDALCTAFEVAGGHNLLDPANTESGYYSHSSGVVTPKASKENVRSKSPIPIPSGATTINISTNIDTSEWESPSRYARVLFLDENGQYLSYTEKNVSLLPITSSIPARATQFLFLTTGGVPLVYFTGDMFCVSFESAEFEAYGAKRIPSRLKLDFIPQDDFILQSTGEGDTVVMSQKAVTDIVSGKDIIEEIDLTKYAPINFNFEGSEVWVASNTYRGVLIPIEDLSDTIRVDSISYAAKIAFLKDDDIVAGETPHFCEGVGGNISTAVGKFSQRSIPDDCRFVYVYVSNGAVIGQFTIKSYTVSALSYPYAGRKLFDDTEIDLSVFGREPYNLDNGKKWVSNPLYNCVLIPTSILTRYIKLYAKEYRCGYAFLKDNVIVNGERPNLCVGEKVSVIREGNEKVLKIPADCKYVYVYVSDGSFFGKFGLVRISEKNQADIMTEKIEGGKVFINDTEQMLLTLKHTHTGSVSGFSATNTADNLFTAIHTADVHTDATSYARFIGFANDNDSHIDCAVVSGDLVDNMSSSECSQMIPCETALSESVALMKCIGNHERNGGQTLDAIYTMYGMNTNTGKLYHYKDFADKKIRVICLNQYDGSSPSQNVTYSQEQIDWFISSLKDATTKDYAVVVVYHSCEEVGFPTYNYSGFCQEINYEMTPLATKPIISDIINAFQGGKQLNDTYAIADTTVTVSADFTSEGTFVCYLCGHQHVDFIGYSKVYPNQLICMVQGGVINSSVRTEESAHWQSRYDTPRVEGTSTADSINVYSIDTTNRLLKVVKIGSTMTDKFVPRTFATFKF